MLSICHILNILDILEYSLPNFPSQASLEPYVPWPMYHDRLLGSVQAYDYALLGLLPTADMKLPRMAQAVP